jgi:hypothetical protein
MKGLDRWLYPTVAVICSCFVWLGELEAQTSLVVNRFQIVSAAGTAVENCQGLKSALASIMDAANDNPYTIRLEPGEYDCGAGARAKALRGSLAIWTASTSAWSRWQTSRSCDSSPSREPVLRQLTVSR